MNRLSKRSALLATLVLAVSACSTPEQVEEDLSIDAAAAELTVNKDPAKVVVYSNNLENMIFDWKDLVHWMALQDLKPDLFLVQQSGEASRLDELATAMSNRLGSHYSWVIAQRVPTDPRFSGEVKPRPLSTTAIIYRSARFEVTGGDKWFPWGKGFNADAFTCDARTDNSGYQTLRVKLHDKLADKTVVVTSLRHWTWHSCSLKNLLELADGQPGTGENAHPGLGAGDLELVGGDFNEAANTSDGSLRCWYKLMNHDLGGEDCSGHANLGFTDPQWEQCSGDRACFNRNSNIDFLFGRHGNGRPARSTAFHEIDWDEGNQANIRYAGSDPKSNTVAKQGFDDVATRYSGHRALRANFFY